MTEPVITAVVEPQLKATNAAPSSDAASASPGLLLPCLICVTPSVPPSIELTISPSPAASELHAVPLLAHSVNVTTSPPTVLGPVYWPLALTPPQASFKAGTRCLAGPTGTVSNTAGA